MIKILLIALLLCSCYRAPESIELEPNVQIKRGYFDNGSPQYEFTYKLGKLDGASKTWDSSGNLISIVTYKSGKLDGKWETFYITGQLKNSIVYMNGAKNGVELWYHPNGQKQSEVLYENNKIISKKLRWDEKGKQINH